MYGAAGAPSSAHLCGGRGAFGAHAAPGHGGHAARGLHPVHACSQGTGRWGSVRLPGVCWEGALAATWGWAVEPGPVGADPVFKLSV